MRVSWVANRQCLDARPGDGQMPVCAPSPIGRPRTGPRWAAGRGGGPVTRYDRYMLSQLLALFGFFSLVLVLVYWVNRAVVLFDRLIANGHSAWVFVEFDGPHAA